MFINNANIVITGGWNHSTYEGMGIRGLQNKKCKGSILPGWLIHGTLNFVTQLLQLW